MRKDDLARAEALIREAIPDAIFDRYDYDFSLRVADARLQREFVIYQIARPDIHQPEIVGNVSDIISRLK